MDIASLSTSAIVSLGLNGDLDNKRNAGVAGVQMKNNILFKIGGSAFDYDRENTDKSLKELCERIDNLKGYDNIYICCGSGQLGDVIKDFNDKYKLNDIKYLLNYASSLNLKMIMPFFSNKDKKIWFLDNFDEIESDLFALKKANQFNCNKIIFVKRTDAVYKYDPFMNINDNYPIFPKISKELNFKKISFFGTDNRDNHLIEKSAINYLLDNNMEIFLLHINYKEMFNKEKNYYIHRILKTKLPQKSYDILNIEIFKILTGEQN